MSEQSEVLTMTPRAAARVKALLATSEGASGIRVGVRQMGCSDMSYTMDFAQDVKDGEVVVEREGATVVVDPKAIPYLAGSELDFVEEKLASRFVFNNPNVTGQCGCGESFKVG